MVKNFNFQSSYEIQYNFLDDAKIKTMFIFT